MSHVDLLGSRLLDAVLMNCHSGFVWVIIVIIIIMALQTVQRLGFRTFVACGSRRDPLFSSGCHHKDQMSHVTG